MAQDEAGEGQGVGRVEAFSDGVIAIIITIMVLELKVPAADGIRNILAMWHLFLAYALSYIYVGLYWGNHHRLLGHARTVGNALMVEPRIAVRPQPRAVRHRLSRRA